MTIARLETPLRVTWDLYGPAETLPASAVLAIAARLVDAGVFYVTLSASPLAHPGIADILALLRDGGVQVQVVFGGTEGEWQGLAAIAPPPALCIDANTFLHRGDEAEWEALRLALTRLQGYGVQPAIMMVPDRARLPLLPRLCTICRAHGVTRIKLPNTPVDANFPAQTVATLPTVDQLTDLRKIIDDPLALRAGLTMEVHDLFLWEILFPLDREEGRAEYGGCQAANSLAHIDARGMVHPCSSWPQEMGSLLESDFATIWQEPIRGAILAKIADLPAGCAACGDYQQCFGGCRGLVETLGTAAEGRDLLCSGPRPTLQTGRSDSL